MKTKDYAAAVKCFEHAVRSSRRYARAQMNLGIAYNGMEDYAHGAEALRKGLKKAFTEPYLYFAHYQLGVALTHLKSMDEAASEFQKAYELKPEFAPAKQEWDRIRGT